MDTLKNIAGAVIGLAVVVGTLMLGIALLRGGATLAARNYDVVIAVTRFATVAMFIGFVLLIFPQSRPIGGVTLTLSSFVVGAALWIWALLYVLATWGWGAVIIGLLFAGVGTVPMALVASILAGEWAIVGQVALGLAMIIGARIAGAWGAGGMTRDDRGWAA